MTPAGQLVCLICRTLQVSRLDRLCAWSAGLKRFKALMRREVILVQRTLFIYYFKTSQVVIMVSLPCRSALEQLMLFPLTHVVSAQLYRSWRPAKNAVCLWGCHVILLAPACGCLHPSCVRKSAIVAGV